MARYEPLKITGFETGLVQERENFLLVSDAFPVLENAYVFREAIRKKGAKRLVGRLRRVLTAQALAAMVGSPYTVADVLAAASINVRAPGAPAISETYAEIECETVVITFDSGGANQTVLKDINGDGDLAVDGADPMGFTSGTINYVTGAISVSFAAPAAVNVQIDLNYFPNLPVMGIRTRELGTINLEDVIAFDRKYAYQLVSGAWQEFITGTTWRGSNSDFFWSTNYWVDASNNKLMWVSNYTDGANGDPIRYTNGTTWTQFNPLITSTDSLFQARLFTPFRGRMIMLNTWEGATGGGLSASVNFPQRIRWSQIGTPLDVDAFRDDIRGKGGYLDIPTSQEIMAIGFVGDALLVFCERSSWELRYTGRAIQPFDIERINTQLGTGSPFSSVLFPKDVKVIGDRQVLKCNAFETEPIDIKIPDLTLDMEIENDGHLRIHGIRDYPKRIASWCYPWAGAGEYQNIYPSRRLVYNYEDDAWAIFKDSITCFGYRWNSDDITWEELTDVSWEEYLKTWVALQKGEPVISAGNQQGYVHDIDQIGSNDPSLFIQAITSDGTNPTQLTVISHNLATNDIIRITGIPTGTDYADTLNNYPYSVVAIDADTIRLMQYSRIIKSINIAGAPDVIITTLDTSGLFDGDTVTIRSVQGTEELNGNSYTVKDVTATTFTVVQASPTAYIQGGVWSVSGSSGGYTVPQIDAAGLTYVGCGELTVLNNVRILTKKFNKLEEGKKIRVGHIDALFTATQNGAVGVNAYWNYQDTPSNDGLDTFFNTSVSTAGQFTDAAGVDRHFRRIYTNIQGDFVQFEFKMTDEQMASDAAESDLEIHAMIVWQAAAGRLTYR